MDAATTASLELPMPVRDLLLPELDLEATFTRKHLQRVPMTALGFKPHSKSMSLGELATFVTVIPTWGQSVLTTDAFDVAPEGTPVIQKFVAQSQRELLDIWEANIAAARTALEKASDAHLQKPWSLLATGRVIFTQQRYLVFRTLFLNHLVHHRAQLGVFFRLLGVPVPAVYNDSADEKGGMFIE
jgi:uncharacterized damage-inducible protein DinB